MVKYLITLVCTLLFLASVTVAKKGDTPRGRSQKLTIKELDASEIKKIMAYNHTRLRFALDGIKYDRELMTFAQTQAELMAAQKTLFAPKLETDRGFHGYAFRITGVANKTYVGKKMCFDNIAGIRPKIIEIKTKCNDDEIDWRKDMAVGFGRKYDASKTIYFVKILLSQQEKGEFIEEKVAAATTTTLPVAPSTKAAKTTTTTTTKAINSNTTTSKAIPVTTDVIVSVPTSKITESPSSKPVTDDSLDVGNLDRSSLKDDDSLFLNLINSLKKSNEGKQ